MSFALNIVIALVAGALLLCAVTIWSAAHVVDWIAPGFAGNERHALATAYLRIGAPYVALAAGVSVFAAILNAEGRVNAVSLGTISFNIVLLLTLAWIALSGDSNPSVEGAILAGAIVAGGMAQLAITAVGLSRLRLAPARPSLLSAETRRFFRLAIPGLLASGIPQLKLIAGTIIASSSPATVSWLYYANRLYELPLGVASAVISMVMAPAIASQIRSRGSAAQSQSQALTLAIGLTLPAAIGLALLAEPIAAGLFQRGAFGPRDTSAVAAALAAIAAGLPGHVLEKVLGAVSFAHEDTHTPMFAALAGLITAVVGALILFPPYGHTGIAAAIAISGWVGATIMIAALWRRGWLHIERSALVRLAGIIVAAVVMGVMIAIARAAIGPVETLPGLLRVVSLAALVAFGLAAYLVGLRLFGVLRLRDVTMTLKRRR